MKYLIFSTFLFLVAIFFLSYRFWGYGDRLIEIKGIVEYYSFTKDSDGRGGKNYHYFLSLKGDGNRYQIPAKFTDDFKIREFERDVKFGDSVGLLIDSEKNAINGSLTVYGLRSGSSAYMIEEDTTRADTLEKNIAIPFFFIFFTGIGLLNLRKFKKENKRTTTQQTGYWA